MILLWGPRTDSPLAAVASALARRPGGDVVWIEPGPAERVALSMRCPPEPCGVLVLGGREVDLRAIRAAYLRPSEGPLHLAPDDPRRAAAAALDDALLCWAELTRALVLNRPAAMASNNSKPYQLSLLRRLGLRVPETLVTTDSAAAEAFWRRHGEVVYKSISGVRSRVSRLRPEHAGRLREVAWCPTQFQQYVAGTEYRVHVVGRRTFASRVVSSADDYRYAGDSDVELEPTVLPEQVEEACRQAAHGLGLALAGIDLRRSAEGDWFALEVNPSPGFTYYESQTGQPIADAVADLLAAGAA